MTDIPGTHRYLVERTTPAIANLALTLADGTPQVSPIWFDFDGSYFIFNTARGRVKDKAMHRHGMVAFSIADPRDPYVYLLVRGPVVSETEEGGYEGICDLNEKYHGNRDFPKRPETRVVYKVLPTKVFASQ